MVERASTASSPAPAAQNSDPQQFLGITEGEDVPNACRFSAILHRATASTAGTRLCEGGRHLGVNTNVPTRHLVSTNLGNVNRLAFIDVRDLFRFGFVALDDRANGDCYQSIACFVEY